jgi:hypothetical protein
LDFLHKNRFLSMTLYNIKKIIIEDKCGWLEFVFQTIGTREVK